MRAFTLAFWETVDGSAVKAATLLSPFVAVFVVAFLVSYLFTPLMRIVAVRYGVVDQPDFKRKAHLEPVAYLGGAALLMGWLAGVATSRFVGIDAAGPLQEGSEGLLQLALLPVKVPLGIILGAAVITATGLIDDIYGISPRVKVGGQLFAAAALAWNNVAIGLVGDTLSLVNIEIHFYIAYSLATVLIALLVVGGCNAMNLLDGLDGLAAGVTAIAATAFLLIVVVFTLRVINAENSINVATNTLLQKNLMQFGRLPVILVMCLAMLGTVVGFLPYNTSPANIFMGDAGSLLLGYLCAATVLLFAEAPPQSFNIAAPQVPRGPLLVMAALIVVGVPVCDTFLAVFRRKLRGKPILSPDNQHLHHLLIHAGFSVKKSVAIMYLFGLICALLGCSLIYLELGGRFVAPIFMVVFAFVVATAYKYGHRSALIEQKGGQTREYPEAAADPNMESGVNPAIENGNGDSNAAKNSDSATPDAV